MMIRYSAYIKGSVLVAVLALTSCQPAARSSIPATPETIQKQIDSSKGLLLVHVWATWCDPCREEFPELINVFEKFQSLEKILISADDPAEQESVDSFLDEHNSPVRSLISTELSQKFIETLSPKWAGSLPATFFYVDGRLMQEWEGKRTYEEYAETIEILFKN